MRFGIKVSKNADMVFMRKGWWRSMNRKTVFLLVITLFSMFIPLVSANAPTRIELSTYQIEGNGVDVPEGYWVYGTFENEACYWKLCRMNITHLNILDDVRNYVPEWPVKPQGTITSYRLLAHRSGINHYQDFDTLGSL